MHKTRSELPKTWPLPRKGTKYFMVGSHSTSDGIPLVIALRDILKLVATAKEVRILRLNKEVKVNGKIIHDDAYPVRLFDVITVEKLNKNYKLSLAGKRIKFKEVSGKESETKIVKVIGKVLVSKDKYQMNLEDGKNMFVKEKFSTGDSAVISLKENKLSKLVPLKEGAKVLIVSGKHVGKEGKLKEIITVNNRNQYLIKFEESEVVLPLKTILAIE